MHADYTSRINNVFDYIEENIDKNISLDELATVSHFSKYHFSRIFDAMVGETPFEFIKRVRLEKGATLLRTHPDKTVTEIALRCGFNDLAVFSRNFRDCFDVSSTKWREQSPENSNHSQTFDKPSSYHTPEQYRTNTMKQLQWAEVRDLPQTTVAYLRHTGPYKGDEELFNRLFGQLFAWAGPRGLMEQRNTAPLVIYHDDPCVTEEEKLRMSVCLPVPSDTSTDGEVGKMSLTGGRFLVARFVVAPQKMPEAWQWVYGSWFPSSGYQPADALPYEVYPAPPEDGQLIVEICVPLRPL